MTNVFRSVSHMNVFVFIFTAACLLMPTLSFGQQSKTLADLGTSSIGTTLSETVLSNPKHVTFNADSNPTANPAPSRSGYNWTGFYVGGHVGYNWGKADTSFNPLPDPTTFVNLAPTTLKPDPKGFQGGIQGGYNWQRHYLIIGGEVDFTWTDVDGTARLSPIPQNNGTPFPGPGFLISSQKTSWTNSYRFRGGVAIDRVLLYGTIGLVLGRVNYMADSDFRTTGTENYPANFAKTRSGAIGGGGGEVGITKHLSVKAEYLYYDLRKAEATIGPAIPFPPGLPNFQVQYRWKTQANTFNAGVNYRF